MARSIKTLGISVIFAAVASLAAAQASAHGTGVASASGCGGQMWPSTIHFKVVDGRLGERVLDCRRDLGPRRIDTLLSTQDYIMQLWEKAFLVLPREIRGQISELILTASHPATANGNMAYVSLADPNANQFNFGVSIHGFERPGDWNKRGIMHRVIHEAAHIISLNRAQTEPRAAGQNCQTHQPWHTRCSTRASYIEAFRRQFWATGAPDARHHAFVSSYARTNVEEDFAETFTAWVLTPEALRPGTVLGEKAAFFDGQPELVSIRAYIWARLAQ